MRLLPRRGQLFAAGLFCGSLAQAIGERADCNGKAMGSIPFEQDIVVAVDQEGSPAGVGGADQLGGDRSHGQDFAIEAADPIFVPGRQGESRVEVLSDLRGGKLYGSAPCQIVAPARGGQVIGDRGEDIGRGMPDIAAPVAVEIQGINWHCPMAPAHDPRI